MQPINVFGISILFLLSSGLFFLSSPVQEVFAASSVSWQIGGANVTEAPLGSGDVLGTDPSLIIEIRDTSLASNGISDTVDVTLTGDQTGDSFSLTLSETGANTGVFLSDDILLMQGLGRFTTSDTITVQVQDDDCSGNPCDANNPDTLDGASFEGVSLFSDSDAVGISIDLVETGDNTLTFQGSFTLTAGASAGSALNAVAGDTITIFDDNSFEFVNILVIPANSDKGAINAVPSGIGEILADTYFVTASYDSVSDGTVTNQVKVAADAPAGRGGGGLIRPGLVVDSPSSSEETTSGGDGCANDCEAPTLGMDSKYRRLVFDGFTYNGHSTDVERFFTPYPLITVDVGKQNTAVFKIYENTGPQNIEHFSFAFGLGKDHVISQSKAMIELDISHDGTETVTVTDPENALGNIDVTTIVDDCNGNNKMQCLIVTINHMFREPLDFNIVGTDVWDRYKNSFQNYYNHGIEVIGPSMNPPDEYDGIYKGQIYHLTETGKTTAVDEFGNSWSLKYGKWYMDYIPNQKIIDDVAMNGYNREHALFDLYKRGQLLIAEHKLIDMCPKCIDEPYSEIHDIFYYTFGERYHKSVDPEIIDRMTKEALKAEDTKHRMLDPYDIKR